MITENLQVYRTELNKDIISILDLADQIYAEAKRDGSCSYKIDGVESDKVTGSLVMSHLFENSALETIDELMRYGKNFMSELAGVIPSQRLMVLKRFFRTGNLFTATTKNETVGKLLLLVTTVITIKRSITVLALRERHSEAFDRGPSYKAMSKSMCSFVSDVSEVTSQLVYPYESYVETARPICGMTDEQKVA